MPNFEAYLEGFHDITVLVPYTYQDGNVESFLAKGNNETIYLEIVKKEAYDTYIKYTLHFNGFIFLNKHYDIIDNRGEKCELYSGEIVRSDLFDELYYYDGNDLGVSYTQSETTFKLWSPVAKEVNVILFEGKTERKISLHYIVQGIWEVKVEEDLETMPYLFEAYVNGKLERFNDPYAIASAANGRYNYIVDPNKFVTMAHDNPFQSIYAADAIIYEASIRDATTDPALNTKHPGTFKAFTEKGLKNASGDKAGFDYLKDLGITHVQLMPIYDFEGVDETHPFKYYNWGYNPSQYNVVEGSFSRNPDDPYSRINELREMVDTLHKNGLSVIMDVVYNHVYNIKTFPFDKIIPGYAYRVDENGVLTNSSGCDSDLATERKMIRKLIVDSVLHWVKTYKIDGFRFDLMGLIDLTTMHIIRQKLEAVDEHILLYGEGWQMPTRLPKDALTHMYNHKTLFNIGFFNDETREHIKGETFKLRSKGYAMGTLINRATIKKIIQAATHKKGGIQYPSQSINYVECHDNHTFYDKALVAMKDAPEAKRLRAQRLSLEMVMLMQGVPFIHMGQEFARSKNGVENSYKSPDSINMVKWENVSQYQSLVQALKTLIKVRKSHDLLRLKTAYEIKNHTHVRTKENGTIIYELKNHQAHLIIIFKNNDKEERFTFEDGFDIIYQSEPQDENKAIKSLTLNTMSTTVLKQ